MILEMDSRTSHASFWEALPGLEELAFSVGAVTRLQLETT
jgi:hypothetical protein